MFKPVGSVLLGNYRQSSENWILTVFFFFCIFLPDGDVFNSSLCSLLRWRQWIFLLLMCVGFILTGSLNTRCSSRHVFNSQQQREGTEGGKREGKTHLRAVSDHFICGENLPRTCQAEWSAGLQTGPAGGFSLDWEEEQGGTEAGSPADMVGADWTWRGGDRAAMSPQTDWSWKGEWELDRWAKNKKK